MLPPAEVPPSGECSSLGGVGGMPAGFSVEYHSATDPGAAVDDVAVWLCAVSDAVGEVRDTGDLNAEPFVAEEESDS